MGGWWISILQSSVSATSNSSKLSTYRLGILCLCLWEIRLASFVMYCGQLQCSLHSHCSSSHWLILKEISLLGILIYMCVQHNKYHFCQIFFDFLAKFLKINRKIIRLARYNGDTALTCIVLISNFSNEKLDSSGSFTSQRDRISGFHKGAFLLASNANLSSC